MKFKSICNLMGAATLVAALLTGCAQPSADGAGRAAGATGANVSGASTPSPYQPTATFQEIMDSVVDLSSDYIWNAVSTTIDDTGMHVKEPRTPAEWHELRRRAVLLAEAANLIAVPGRRIAKGDRTAESDEPLPAAEIQARLDSQHEQLVGFAAGMRDVAVKLMDAADRRDVKSVTDLGGTLDGVCEACHLVFWYPPQSGSTESSPAKAATKP